MSRSQDVSVCDERSAAEELSSVHERGHEGILVLPRHPPVQDLGHQVGPGRQSVHAAQGIGVVGRGVVAVEVVVFICEVFKLVIFEPEVRVLSGQGMETEVVVDVVHGLVVKVEVDVVLGLFVEASGLRLIVRTARSVDLKKRGASLLSD